MPINAARFDAIGESLYFAKRLLQVMRGYKGEVLQLAITPLKSCGEFVQLLLRTLPLCDLAFQDQVCMR